MSSSSPLAILFDIDGTLMDDDRAVSLALNSFHASHGHELGLSLEGLATRWKHLTNLHFARYLAGEVSMEDQRRARILDLFASAKPALTPAEADLLFAAYLSDYRASWCAYPDTLPTLAALFGRFALAVLSNGDQSQQTCKLQACALDSYFSQIVTSSGIGCAKPAPEAFLISCRQLGIPPARCVYVGDDAETDARASAAAGMIGVWLDRSGSGAAPGSDIHVIHGLAELLALLPVDRLRRTAPF